MSATLPEWQRGYELAELKQYTAVFDKHDEGFVRSRFGRVSERTIAEHLGGGLQELRGNGAPRAVILWRRASSAQWLKDFSGAERAQVQAGDIVVKRMAGPLDDLLWLLEDSSFTWSAGDGRIWYETWAESPQDRRLLSLLSAEPALTKIRASSEIIQVSYSGPAPVLFPAMPAEEPGLCRLEDHYAYAGPARRLLAALEGLTGEPDYADHYSVYGKGRSWGAIALRGYAPPGEQCDPAFIIKPSEMSKKWKEENADKLEWEPAWSELGHALGPQLRPFLEDVAEDADGLDRVRLMQLQPGGGEIRRHADITDREAGVRDGMVSRLHFPLKTNPACIASSWSLAGQEHSAHMGEGECWYLDIRKPHTVINGGSEPRVHLVIDCRSNALLRERLIEAPHAQPVREAVVPV